MAKRIKLPKKSVLKQPDEFLSFTAKILKYVKDNESKFIIASIIILVGIFIISFSVYYIKKVNTMGFAQLSKALDEEDIAKRKKILEDIKKSRFTYAKSYASFFLAQIYKEENNIPSAKKELEKASEIKDNYLRSNAKIMLIDLLLKEGKLDDALKYARERDKDIPKFLKDELMFKEALILEKKNNLKEAVQIYKSIESSNPDFYLIKLLQSKISM